MREYNPTFEFWTLDRLELRVRALGHGELSPQHHKGRTRDQNSKQKEGLSNCSSSSLQSWKFCDHTPCRRNLVSTTSFAHIDINFWLPKIQCGCSIVLLVRESEVTQLRKSSIGQLVSLYHSKYAVEEMNSEATNAGFLVVEHPAPELFCNKSKEHHPASLRYVLMRLPGTIYFL